MYDESASDRIPTEEERRTILATRAGRLAFGMNRTATYKAIKDSTFPLEVIRAGGQLFVRTRDLRELLRLDEPLSTAP
jgi:hypothetical protein